MKSRINDDRAFKSSSASRRDPIVAKSQFLSGQSGVIAQKKYRKGDVVFIVKGPVTTERTIYTFPLSLTQHIDPRDASGKPTLGHFLNHSCNPNTFVRIVNTEHQKYVEVVARHNIAAGTELTFDYALAEYEVAANKTVCKCGAVNCTGKIIGYKDLPAAHKEKYILEGLVASYLLELDNQTNIKSSPTR